jgi:hypothetical protein
MSSRVVRMAALGALAWSGCASAPNANVYLETPAETRREVTTGEGLGGTLRFSPELCKGEPLGPEFAPLTEQAVVSFLRARGLEVRALRARSDLVYVDVVKGGVVVRLRVAILKSAHEAGRELHDAVLEHGPGSWGVHRSNLAVLGPIGSVEQVVSFVSDTKLACWGVVTAAGRDDAFVIPGGYTEL